MSAGRPLGGAMRAQIALPFAIVTLLWGSTWIVIRGQIGLAPVGWSICYRFAVASASMMAVALVTRTSLRTTVRDQAMLALMGLLIFCLNFLCVYNAEDHVTSGVVAVTFSLIVIFNALLGRLVFGQMLSKPFLLGSAVAFGGMLFLFAHEIGAVATHPGEALLGIGLALLGAFMASIANVMQSSARLRALPMPAVLAWGMMWGALFNAALASIAAGPPVFPLVPTYIAGVLYLGIGASALAFTLYFGMIRLIGPARGGYVNVLTPVLAMLFSTIFEGYHWTPTAIAGGVLVMLGLVLAMRARSPAR